MCIRDRSTRHGGEIVTDPADTESLKLLEPVVLLDVQLQGGPALRPADDAFTIGERAWVRFGGAATPLVLQLAQALRQQVLRRFSAQQ